MNLDCLQHTLSLDQRSAFESQGFLIVENALDQATTASLIDVVDRVETRERNTDNRGTLLSVTDVVQEDNAILELVTCAKILPKVWGILGWNISLYHSHLDVTPTENARAQNWSVAWHQDSMRVNDEIESSPRPRLSLKVGFYLTDLTTPDGGNTLVVPGSQLQNELSCPQDGQSSPAGAQPVCVPAGSAIILDRRTWHSRSANRSDRPRKVIWLGYSYRWMKPKDEMTVRHLYPQLSPIQRQLLGDGPANSAYDPREEHVPLRTWLQEHDPAAAGGSPHGASQSRPPAMSRGNHTGRI
ncbi:MAG: phytanoyl-CoA dioxygenase family protein [Planctomycetaceae bacterium]